jgi:ADP-heptose:LPS heptosyltransferase
MVRMNPYVDEVLLFKVRTFNDRVRRGKLDAEFWKGMRELSARLRGYRFTTALVTQSAFRTGMLAWMSGAGRRVGYGESREAIRYFLTDFLPFVLQTRPGEEAVEFLRYLGFPDPDPSLYFQPPPPARARADELLKANGIETDRGVALCPATAQAQKQWTEAGWATVVDALQEIYGYRPLFLGGPGDAEMIARINALAGKPAPSLAGVCTLEESAAVVQRCAFTLSVDTGMAFVSLGVGTPLVMLHAVSPFTGRRMRDEPNAIVVAPPDPCGDRFNDYPRRYHCPDCACMAKITPAEVLYAIDRRFGPWRPHGF